MVTHSAPQQDEFLRLTPVQAAQIAAANQASILKQLNSQRVAAQWVDDIHPLREDAFRKDKTTVRLQAKVTEH